MCSLFEQGHELIKEIQYKLYIKKGGEGAQLRILGTGSLQLKAHHTSSLVCKVHTQPQ